eukprot:1222359-Rhodomonas_salina.2
MVSGTIGSTALSLTPTRLDTQTHKDARLNAQHADKVRHTDTFMHRTPTTGLDTRLVCAVRDGARVWCYGLGVPRAGLASEGSPQQGWKRGERREPPKGRTRSKGGRAG